MHGDVKGKFSVKSVNKNLLKKEILDKHIKITKKVMNLSKRVYISTDQQVSKTPTIK